jgi:hypothetical protein
MYYCHPGGAGKPPVLGWWNLRFLPRPRPPPLVKPPVQRQMAIGGRANHLPAIAADNDVLCTSQERSGARSRRRPFGDICADSLDRSIRQGAPTTAT